MVQLDQYDTSPSVSVEQDANVEVNFHLCFIKYFSFFYCPTIQTYGKNMKQFLDYKLVSRVNCKWTVLAPIVTVIILLTTALLLLCFCISK